MTFEEWWNRDAYNLLYNAAKPGIVQKWQARAIWREAVTGEREKCARIAEGIEIRYSHNQCYTAAADTVDRVAAAIREQEADNDV